MLKIVLLILILPLFEKSPILPAYPEKQAITQDLAKEALLPPAVESFTGRRLTIKAEKIADVLHPIKPLAPDNKRREPVSCGGLSDAVKA